MRIILTESQFKQIVHLDESIKQGEDLYRKLYGEEIPKDNLDYNELKDLLIKNNNVGYMPWLVKLSVNGDFFIGLDVYKNLVLPNKDNIKRLPKQLIQYNDVNELDNDIKYIKRGSNVKKIMNLIPKKNMNLYNDFEEDLKFDVSEYEIDYFVDNIYPTKFLKVFTNKISRYNNSKNLIRYFKDIIIDHERGFIYELMLPKIKSLGKDVEILSTKNDEKESYIFLWSKTYEALQLVGSSAWCIVQDKQTFKSYTDSAEQFVLIDFYNDDINYGVIGFTVNKGNGDIVHSHLRDDEYFTDKAEDYLRNRKLFHLIKIGVNYVKKIKTIDTEMEIFNLIIPNVIKNNKRGDAGYHIINPYVRKILNTIFETNYKLPENSGYIDWSKIYSDLFLKNVQDYSIDKSRIKEILVLAHKKMEIIRYPERNFDENKKNFIGFSLRYYYFFQKFISDIFKNDSESIITVQEVIEEMYKNGFGFDDLTKRIIERKMLEKYGREKTILFLKMRQDKTNKEYNPVVFHGTKDRTNYKSQILDKIQMSRRQNYNELMLPEVKYAMENGLESSIKDLYGRLLNTYSENQLDYEDMNIYKHIGMFNELEKVITKKGDVWGKDSLNSIEYSIYELSKRKEQLNK
jgi:hypothetical protein